MTDVFELPWSQVGLESTSSVLRILGTSHEKYKQVINSKIQKMYCVIWKVRSEFSNGLKLYSCLE